MPLYSEEMAPESRDPDVTVTLHRACIEDPVRGLAGRFPLEALASALRCLEDADRQGSV